MRLPALLLLLLALAPAWFVAETPTEAKAARVAQSDTTAYTLPPAELRRAVALTRIRMPLELVGEVWTLLQLGLILSLGAAARMSHLAVRLSRHRWVQGYAFVFLLLLTMLLLDLPLSIYGHRVALNYGLSVQGWGSWFADKGKLFALDWGIGGFLAVLAMEVIRRSPTRWWFWFSIPAVCCVVAGVFVTPYVIDPLFNRFEPLAATNPALVARLEQVVARSGIAIPPDRMFLMRASVKTTELNAYVTGFGASKRVVVWDTTIARSTPDEIAFIFAHELGHYALGHVALGTAIACLSLLPGFWLAYLGMDLLLRRYGTGWGIPSQRDWGALAALALVLMTLSAVADPASNSISRWMEHNADVYGEEAMHGIVANPQTLGRQTFQMLGEDSLDDPVPHPLFDWWFDNHPTTEFRAAFALAYDPWAPGAEPKFFPK